MGSLKNLFKYSKNDSLIRDSATLFIATFGLNLSGFLFHFFMGRYLGPSSYGILGVIFSLFYFFLVAVFVVQTTITNFVSTFHAKNQDDKINVLLHRALRKFFILSIVVIVLFLLFSNLISKFLHIPVRYLWIMSPMIIFSFLLPVNRAVMQGLEWFKTLGINMTIEGVAKLILGVLFVFIGWGVGGAIFALILSYVLPFVLSFIVLRKYLVKKKTEFDSKPIYKYSIPVVISLLIFTGFYTVDVILIKHFLSEELAGLYIALTFLGKIIFFGTQSIALVMFPKSVANYAVNKVNKNIVNKAMIIVGILGGVASLIYFVLPELVIKLVYGESYLAVSNALGWYGLVMLVLSLAYVLVFYNLSLSRKRFVYILLFFLILETILIYFYHASIMQIVLILLVLMSIMFIVLLWYTYNVKTVNNNASL